MTSTVPRPTVTRAPGSVVLVRVLVPIQAVVALGAAALTGFLTLWVMSEQVDERGGITGDALGLIALASAFLALAVTLLICAARLRPGAENVRRTLLVLESVLVTGLLVISSQAAGPLTLLNGPSPVMLFAVSTVASLLALLQPSSRAYTAR